MHIILSFCFLFWSIASFSQGVDLPLADLMADVPYEDSFSHKQLKLIREELYLQSLFIEAVEKISISNGEFINYTNAQSATRDIIIQASLSRYVFKDDQAKKLFIVALKEFLSPKYLKDNLKYLVGVIKRFVIWQKNSLVTTSRTQGLKLALVKFMAIQLDVTIPAILIMTGNVIEGIGLFLAPVSPVTYLPFQVAKTSINNIKLLKSLGIQRSKEAFNISKEIRKRLKQDIFSTKRLLNANFLGHHYVLNVQLKSRLAQYLDSKNYKQGLTFQNLVSFMEDYHEFDDVLSEIRRSRVDENLKLYTLIAHIEHNADKNIISTFLEKFKKSFIKSKNIDIPRIHRRWFFALAHAKDFTSFYWTMYDMPKDMHPQLFDKIYRQYVLPRFAENLANTQGVFGFWNTNKVFKSLMNEYDHGNITKNIPREITELRGDFGHAKYSSFTVMKKAKLIDYIWKALSPIAPCEIMFNKHSRWHQ